VNSVGKPKKQQQPSTVDIVDDGQKAVAATSENRRVQYTATEYSTAVVNASAKDVRIRATSLLSSLLLLLSADVFWFLLLRVQF